MSQTIDVLLTATGDADTLVFDLDKENPDKYLINLNGDSNQDDIKEVFFLFFQLLVDDDVTLNYIVSDGYSKKLFIEVCQEYVEELNKELVSVREEIKKSID